MSGMPSEQIQLTEAQRERLTKRLKKDVGGWVDAWSPLQNELDRRYNMLEGVVEDSDYPFIGASNLHIPVPLIYTKVFHTVARRSILASGRVWYAISSDQSLQDKLADVEDGFNYKALHEWNTGRALNDVFWTTPRDGLGILFVSYRFDTEKVKDCVDIASPEEFIKEFPDADSGGFSDQEYADMMSRSESATEDQPLKVYFEAERITYRGPWCEVVDLSDFVILPATAASVDRRHARGYGRRYFLRKPEIKRMAKEGLLDEEEVSEFLKGNRHSEPSMLNRSRDFSQHISRQSGDELELFDLVYRCPLNPGDDECVYVITWSQEKGVILGIREYDLPDENVVFFRIEEKPNQLIGGAIIGWLGDLSLEIDAIHNMRINSRAIAQVPSFVAPTQMKGKLDPSLRENWFKPGLILWLDNPEGFKQFEIGGLDLNSALLEEDHTMKLCSLVTGVDPFTFSGNPQPDDPEAPGNKTLYLISQANLRMDDILYSLSQGVEKLGKILVSFERKYGPYKFSFARPNWKGGMDDVFFSKNLLRTEDLRFAMAGTNVALNPESELARWFSIHAHLMQEPMYASDPERRIRGLRQALAAGRVQGRNELLPSLEELQQQRQQMVENAQLIGQRAQALQSQESDVSQKEALLQKLKAAGPQVTPQAGPQAPSQVAPPQQ